MRDEKTADKSGHLSRRKFIAGSGVVLGSMLAGAGLVLPGCAQPPTTRTVTLTSTRVQFVSPYDGKAFDTFEELTEYIQANYPDRPPLTRYVSPYDGRQFASLEEFRLYLDGLFARSGFVSLNVNGTSYRLEVRPYWSLTYVIREKLGLTGTKVGCNHGSCGACTVLIDGKAVYSCLVLAIEAQGRQITTIEGLSDGIDLHPVQQAFVNNDAAQCGYCTPGFIMSAKALLDTNPSPTRDEVRLALSGHLCICGHTKKIVDAVLGCSQEAHA